MVEEARAGQPKVEEVQHFREAEEAAFAAAEHASARRRAAEFALLTPAEQAAERRGEAALEAEGEREVAAAAARSGPFGRRRELMRGVAAAIEPTPSEVLSEALYGSDNSTPRDASAMAPGTTRDEQVLGGRMAFELGEARVAAGQPGGGGMELQQCRATLSGLEEAYHRERGDLETGEPEAVGAVIYQGGSPTLPDSPEGSDTDEDRAVGNVAREVQG